MPNELRIQLSSDRMSLLANVSSRRGRFELEPLELDADLAADPLPAYARLLLDVLAGDPTLSIRADEAEESWRIVEPILDAWAEEAGPIREYPAGTSGPPGVR